MAQVISPITVDVEVHGEEVQVVKLLTAKDGKPIKLGSTVYGEDGKQWRIVAIGREYVWGQSEHSTQKRLKPEWLTHERPDSWEQLEKDLSTMSACLRAVACGLVEENSYVEMGVRCPVERSCTSCYKETAQVFVYRAKALAGVE